MKRLSHLLIFLSLALTACRKQPTSQPAPNPAPKEPEWVVYNRSNSPLPDNQVNALSIGKDDVAWIGTANGLCRLGGTQWTLFTPANAGLPSAFIRAVAVPENGTVWAGTDKGLACFNGTGWTSFTTANSALTSNSVLRMVYDSVKKCTWIGTEKELIRVDAAGHWERLDAVHDDIIYSMTTDRNGDLWLGTFNHFAFRGRLKKLSNGQWTTWHLDQLGYASTFPHSLAVDRNNTLTAALGGTSVRTMLAFRNGSWQELGLPTAAVGFRIMYEDDQLWLGGDGLSRFSNGVASIHAIPGGGYGVQALALDSRRGKWMGTLNNGVAVYR